MDTVETTAEATPAQAPQTAQVDAPIVLNTDSPASAQPTADTEATPEPTAEPQYTPDLSALPMTYDVYLETEGNEKEAVMFVFDLDFDGTPEEISFKMDYDNNTTTIFDGSRSIVLEEGAELMDVYLVDLDENTPYANLIICIDMASDDYVSIELHPEGDRLVKGTVLYDRVYVDRGLVFRDERTELLGTRSGYRRCHGEDFTPDSEWLIDDYIPTMEELTYEREDMIGMGILLHAVREVPCTINGEEATLAPGTLLYVLRFHESRTLVEVCTTDNVVAMIAFTNVTQWPPLINGESQDKYFNNVLYAD